MRAVGGVELSEIVRLGRDQLIGGCRDDSVIVLFFLMDALQYDLPCVMVTSKTTGDGVEKHKV